MLFLKKEMSLFSSLFFSLLFLPVSFLVLSDVDYISLTSTGLEDLHISGSTRGSLSALKKGY